MTSSHDPGLRVAAVSADMKTFLGSPAPMRMLRSQF
jgi:hypothetical protein